MLEAISMYFGGDIITSTDCDYQTARELGLICPFCKSAVFVRSESVREIWKKIQLVKPYFAHYPSNSGNDWDCEKRSRTKQGREEVEKLKIQARNQRLRLYNAHLWGIISTDRNFSQQQLNRVRSLFGEAWCERQSILVRHEWSRAIADVYTYIDEAHQSMAQLIEKDPNQKENYLLSCDRRLHQAIACEVADFLGTNTAGFVFLKIFKAALWQTIQASPSFGVREAKAISAIAHISTISVILAATNWITQINNLRRQGQ